MIRLWGVDRESVWWDEYTSLMHLNCGSLTQFLFMLPLFDPAVFPLYYILEYFLWNYIYPSVLLLRIFSVLLSVLVIPLLYLIGKELGNKRVGLFASLLYVLSPVYRFHSQGIRTYVLFLLLAVLSIWLFFRYIQRRDFIRLMSLSFCNLLLTLTHPFALLVVCWEVFCFLIFWGEGGKKNGIEKIKFLVIQFLACVPVFLFSSNFKYFPKELATWFRFPSLVELLFDIFADDAVLWGYQVRSIDFSSPIVSTFFSFFNQVINLLLLVMLFYVFFNGLKSILSRKKREFNLIILYSLVAGSPILLYLFSLVYRPCIFPRYTLYGAVFMYLIAGYVLENERVRFNKTIKWALVVLFLTQLLATVPVVQRTDWKSCTQFIAQSTAKGDKYPLVLVYKDINRDVFMFNLCEKHLVTSYVESEDDIFPIIRYISSEPKCNFSPVFFVYVSQYFGEIGLSNFEEKLRDSNIKYEKKDFDGIEKIRVYSLFPTHRLSSEEKRVALRESEYWQSLKEIRFDLSVSLLEKRYDCGELLAEELAREDPLWELLLRDLIESVREGDRYSLEKVLLSLRNYQLSRRIVWSREHSEYLLQKAIQGNPNLELFAKSFDAIMATVDGNMEYAKENLRNLTEKFPNEPLPKIALGNIALSEGKLDDAKKWYYSAIERDGGIFKEWKRMLDYIFIYGDYRSAMREYERLKKEGVFVESGFESILKELSELSNRTEN
ncbi:MAG: glycosyltransferase family 39 protein [Candidatus Hydrogenedentes bacterium]|nr:glycosyltransferase family 39 protein [Candidatus Hydrogenedentota bacterium]